MTVNTLGDPVYGTIVEISSGFSSSVSAANVGTGAKLFKGAVGNNLEFRSLVSSNGSITFVENTSEIDISINASYLNTAILAALGGLTFTPSRAIITNGSGILTSSLVTSTELGYVSGVTSAIQTQLNSKQSTIIGAATSITDFNLSPQLALVSDAGGKVSISTVTRTELGYLSGVTSLIQNQINTKQAIITGGATTITTANLTPNRFLASNGAGKVVVTALSTSTFALGSTATITVPLVAWSMKNDDSIFVPHGLDTLFGPNGYKRITRVSAMIRDDSDSVYLPLDSLQTTGGQYINGGVTLIDVTRITLFRRSTGTFDSTSYDYTAGSYSRGYATIEYTL